jgi:hypothetical protein
VTACGEDTPTPGDTPDPRATCTSEDALPSPPIDASEQSLTFLELLERDYDLLVSSEFTPEERQWLNNAFEQYATFLGGRDVFVQSIMQQGMLGEIVMTRGGTTGYGGGGQEILALHDFSYVHNGQPLYMFDETKTLEVAFTKLIWHETTHFLQFAIPDSASEYVNQTPELNWEFSAELGVYVSRAPGSGRIEDYERMADAFAATLYNQTYASEFGVSSTVALPEAFRPWLLEQYGR